MILADGLAFPEGPRWRDGRLWFSDMHGHRVCRLGAGGVETVCEGPARPSGLGWLPDGRLLRLENDGDLVTHAALSALASRRCNDMVVDGEGRAYVGDFGFEPDDGVASQARRAHRGVRAVSRPATEPYRIVSDRMGGLLALTLYGFWSADTLKRFEADVERAVLALPCGPGRQRVLVDLTQFPVQAQSLITAIADYLLTAEPPPARLALACPPGLARMQVKRALDPVRMRVCDTVADARTWLEAPEVSAAR